MPWPIALRGEMTRLNQVGFKLRKSTAHLCDAPSAAIGISIDFLGAYHVKDQKKVAQLLAMHDEPVIAAVAPDSPAAHAGIAPGDTLIAINGTPVSARYFEAETPALFADFLEQWIARQPIGEKIDLKLSRGNQYVRAQIRPDSICATRIILRTGEGITAYTDGADIAVSNDLIAFAASDDELALLIGHELAHILTRDPKTKDRAAHRAMEARADILGAKLIFCAGYDIARASLFWTRMGERARPSRHIINSHGSPQSRAAALLALDPATIICPLSGVSVP